MAYSLSWLLRVVLLATLWAATAQPSWAQATSVSLSDYESLVREALAAAQRNDAIGLREAADKLVPITTVLAADETALPVDNRWLDEELERKTPNLREIRSRLGTQVEMLAVAHSDDPEALSKLETILNNPPFGRGEAEPVAADGTNVFVEFLEFLFGAGQAVTGCLTVLAIAVFLGVIVYIVRALRGSMVRQVKQPLALDDEVALEGLDSTKALSRASEVAVEGDFRKAVRYLYLSSLLWLDERGAVRYDRTLTNREVLEAVPLSSPLRSRLAPVVMTFDRVWYGYQEIDQVAFDAFRQQVTALREGRS